MITKAWPVHGIEEDEACEALIAEVLKEVSKVEKELITVQRERRTGSCAYDKEGRTICPAVVKAEQRVQRVQRAHTSKQ
jgi:hypothetical protein